MKRLLFAVLMWMAGFAFANPDPLTDMALASFRQAVATELSSDLEQQAKLLMQVKNGLSLYRDGVLEKSDKASLDNIISKQLATANRALVGQGNHNRRLAELMRDNAQEAQRLLNYKESVQTLSSKIESYQTGIGYDAYRYAQDIGIEQL